MIRRLLGLIVLLGLAAAGLYYYKDRSHGADAPRSLQNLGREIKDTAVTGAVKTAFELNRTLKPLALKVSTESGVVTLQGEVPSAEARGTAERVAAAVPDVREVVNRLTVRGGPAESPRPERSVSETVDDRALDVQVRLALSLNRDLKGTDLQIEVFRKAVTLSGDVARASQRKAALEVARETPGVSGVTDRIRVIGEDRAPKP